MLRQAPKVFRLLFRAKSNYVLRGGAAKCKNIFFKDSLKYFAHATAESQTLVHSTTPIPETFFGFTSPPPFWFCFVAQRGRVIKKYLSRPGRVQNDFWSDELKPKSISLLWTMIAVVPAKRSSCPSGWAQIKRVLVPRKWNYRPQHVACDNTSAQTFFAALLWNQVGATWAKIVESPEM